ncbi:MAG: PfkB family carbohydrate kinase, partial [Bacteroidales bacterium]|nr:PfkB family carbohydrate kinase [Bacteroidales bacterium]
NNDAQYEFYKNHGAANMQGISAFGFRKGDIVLFGSFFAINPKIRDLTAKLLKSAHDAGAILFYDINFRKSHVHEIPEVMANIEQNCRWSTIVRGSSDDFRYLYSTDDPEDVFQNHIKPLCQNFICTQADKTIEVYSGDRHYSYETEKIATVSTIGAGDNFNAGFIYALIHYGIESASSLDSEAWKKCVAIGKQFSSAVCQRIDNYVGEGFSPKISPTSK